MPDPGIANGRAGSPSEPTSDALSKGDEGHSRAERRLTSQMARARTYLPALGLGRIPRRDATEPPAMATVEDLPEMTPEALEKPGVERPVSETMADSAARTSESVEEPPAERRRRRRQKRMWVQAGEPLPDVTAETPQPVEADESPITNELPPIEEAIEERRIAELTANTEVERPESGEEPRSTEPPPADQAIQETAAPAPTRRPKDRVVWKASPAPSVQRAHTLKLTKTAPSETGRRARATSEPAIQETAAHGTLPDATVKPPEPVQKPRTPAPPPIDEPVEETPTAPAPAPPPAEQTCDILFWRGYRKAAFYGRTFDETGEAVAVAESPFFRPQGNGVPEPTEAAKAAYEALRSQLIAAGWEPVAAGNDWCDETFRLTAAPEPGPE
jgi:hypothetical protein